MTHTALTTGTAMEAFEVGDPRGEPLVALLVEDSQADAELMSLRLQTGRFGPGTSPIRLIQRGTIRAACAALRYWHVDVVVLDLTLPDANGLEALHRLRAASPETPVIVLSGVADQALAVKAIRAGAQDYVLKPPPDGHTIARIIRYACERHRLMQTIESDRRLSSIAARQWRLLAELGKVVSASSNPMEAIPQVAELVVPGVADCFVICLTGDDDNSVKERWYDYGERAAGLSEAVQRLLEENADESGSLLASMGDEDADDPLWDEALVSVYGPLGLASGSAVPIRSGGRLRGVLILAFASGRRDPVADTEFTRSVAYRIGVAMEQNRLLKQAQRAIAARDRALSTVSHDLRNALSTIRICSVALLDPEPASPVGIHEMGELISRSVNWMEQIVEDLLDRASLDAGSLALHRRSTSVEEIFDASRQLFALAASERAIDLRVEPMADLPNLDADPHRLLQVLSNLIGNSIKFTAPGGRVDLVAQRVDDDFGSSLLADKRGGVRFTVSDTGSGIPSEDLSHIFERYWHSPKERNKGAGLGLAIAKGLVEAHGSRLYVDSVVGRGTSFWFAIGAVNTEVVGANGNGERSP
jgi:signal transduction histidine kinase/ActR/RegA family two-component response regulator